MAVSKRLRYEILRRDGNRCKYCGVTADEVKLTVDHVIPVALGGAEKDPANLRAACADCNSGKSATPPDAALVADVTEDALRWAAAIKQAQALRAKDRERDQRLVDFMDQIWHLWDDHGDAWGEHPRPDDWRETILAFSNAGLDFNEMADAVTTSMVKSHVAVANKWRYFCGVMWRGVEEQNEIALGILATEGVI